jgi:transcriptional regulator with XRE-family HTH domain
MTGAVLKTARESANLSQEQAAAKLGLTQAYLSMVENGRRRVSPGLEAQVLKVFEVPATALPLDLKEHRRWTDEEWKMQLGAFGYPGFAYLRGKTRRNPAQVLFQALNQNDLDARVVEALPWLVFTYTDMDWEWLVRNAKLNDRQNRLAFVVALAEGVARSKNNRERAQELAAHRSTLEPSRLAKEDTLCHESMTEAERKWLRRNRSREARHWNLLTDLDVRHLAYAHA